MTKHIALLALALAATPAAAEKFKLSEYKTVAVQPVLGATDSPKLYASQFAASAATLSIKAENTAAATKAASVQMGGGSSGFGFAGKAQNDDIGMLMLGDIVGVLPTALKLDPAKAKAQAEKLVGVLSQIEGKISPDAVKAIRLALQAAQLGDFESTAKAALMGMFLATEGIKKGNERAHGYLATGLFAGLATFLASAGKGSPDMVTMGNSLVVYLEQDAALGGADKQVAAQLKLVIAEMASDSPDLNKVVAAIQAMNAVKPD